MITVMRALTNCDIATLLRYFKYFVLSIKETILRINMINPITMKRIDARKEPSITIKTTPRINVINEIINFSI